MNLNDSIEKILHALLQLDINGNVKDQISKAKVGSIEKTPRGFFADISTTSKYISEYDEANPDVSIIRTLRYCDKEIADVILHFKKGIVQYLELQFYESEGWCHYEKASLI